MAYRTRYTLRKSHLKNLELPPFDPERTDYTAFEMEAYTDALLRESTRENPEGPKVLFQEHIDSRWGREVLSTTGTVDDSITSSLSKDGHMMYYRTHPEGRKVNSDQQRKDNGASYYRN
jgi:hypothetical protein